MASQTRPARRESRMVAAAHNTLVQQLETGVLLLTADGRIVAANPAAMAMLGLVGGKIHGCLLSEAAESDTAVITAIMTALDNAAPRDQIIRLTVPQPARTLALSVTAVGEEASQARGWMVTLADVPQDGPIDASRDRAEATFRAIVDTLQDAYFESDPFGHITYVNEAFVRVTGYENKNELIGKHFRHIVARKSLRPSYDHFKKLYQTGAALPPFEFSYRTRDGSEYTSEILASPIIENGRVAGARGMVRDISVRTEAENILREARDAAEHRAGELAAINRVAATVTQSLDLQAILQSLCVEFTGIFPVRNAGIALLNEDETALEVVAFHAVDPTEESALGVIINLEGNLASRQVMENRETVVVQDVQTDPRTKAIHDLSRARGSHSFMLVPLLARGKAIGTIGMPAKDPDHVFTEAEIELAETIASQIATAVQNARLHAQTESALDVVEHDLEIGRQIQAGFFPERLPAIPGWEIAAHFQAARQVAGDFYDVFGLRNSNLTAFVIADVCDKGVGAALFMVLFRSLLRAFSEGGIDAGNIRERLQQIILSTNNYIAEYHGRSNMFATIFFGILDPERGVLHYVNGGHEAPIIVDKAGEITARLMPTGPAVGLFPNMNFLVEQIEMNGGDCLTGFTDGVTDAKSNAGELFSEERLLQVVASPWTSIFSMVFELTSSIRRHIGDRQQFDDITLISFRRKVTPATERHAICRVARMENLAEMRGFVTAAAEHSGLAHEDVFAFKLAADEVCTNIIQYGYGEGEPGLLSLFFDVEDSSARLTVRDDGTHFAPDAAPSPDVETAFEDRAVGGLGLFLVRELMDTVSYDSDAHGNVLVLEKALGSKE